MSNISSRGASNTRDSTSTRSVCSSCRATFLLPFLLQRLEVAVKPVEALLPVPAVALEPVVDLTQRSRLEAARTPLGLAAARDEAGALQDLEVLGDRRQGHVEG